MKLWTEKRTWVSRQAKSKLARLSTDDIDSILVIKHAAYGDLLCMRPFLVTLRQSFPKAKITLSTIEHYQRGTPDDLVDHVHILPTKHKSLMARFHAMRELGHHTLLFDLTESTPSFLLSLFTSAEFKVGYQHRSIHKFIYDVAILRAEYRFETETFLEQLHVLGLQYDWPPDYKMPITAINRSKPYVIYFPTASAKNKSWPAELFIQLIEQTARQYPQYDHIVLSGLADWEIEVANKISSELKTYQNVIKLAAGKDDASLIKGANALVANDTGIRHLAIATETPSVGIFFYATPFGYWPRFGGHQVVFERDGSVPSVNNVKQALGLILDLE